MLIGSSADWPLSREEKKDRLLRLYDKDLKETDRMLQESARQHRSPFGKDPGSINKGGIIFEASKENIGDSFNTNSISIPGVIDDGCDADPAPVSCSPGQKVQQGARSAIGYVCVEDDDGRFFSLPLDTGSVPAHSSAPLANQELEDACPSQDGMIARSVHDANAEGREAAPVDASHHEQDRECFTARSFVECPSARAMTARSSARSFADARSEWSSVHDDAGPAPCSSAAAEEPRDAGDAQSSQDGLSARSFEYMTPEPTPRTPAGYNNAGLPRVVLAQRPISAPAGPPNPTSGKDFQICQRTGTLIPTVPRMPTGTRRAASASRVSSDGGAAMPPVPPMPPPRRHCSAERADHPSRSANALPRRPYSAAAAAAFSACGARRTSTSSEDVCNPQHVFSAARHGRYAEVEAALLAGFVPSFADPHGNTLFHVACQNGRRRIAKLVVKHGCDMNTQNLKGNTGLHFLFAYGYPEIAEYFIKKGALEQLRNHLGLSAREGIK